MTLQASFPKKFRKTIRFRNSQTYKSLILIFFCSFIIKTIFLSLERDLKHESVMNIKKFAQIAGLVSRLDWRIKATKKSNKRILLDFMPEGLEKRQLLATFITIAVWVYLPLRPSRTAKRFRSFLLRMLAIIRSSRLAPGAVRRRRMSAIPARTCLSILQREWIYE